MDLNNHQDFSSLDSENMLEAMNGLPEQLLTAWEEAGTLPLADFSQVKQVRISDRRRSAESVHRSQLISITGSAP